MVVVEVTVAVIVMEVAVASKAIVIIHKEVSAVVEVTVVKARAEVDMVLLQAVMVHHKEMVMVDHKEWKQETWQQEDQEKIQSL